jgi:multimeric flavodoxin WrbA
MKVVAFDGSATRDGSIAALLRRVLAELEAEGLETELLHLQKDRRTGCYMCGQCAHKRDSSCSRPADDGLRRCVRRILAADGLVVGSPAYAAGSSPATQALFQRLERAGRDHADRLSCKVAAAVVDARSAGAARTAARLNGWFEANEMIVVAPPRASREEALTAGREGDGAEGMARLGHAMAGLLKRLHG